MRGTISTNWWRAALCLVTAISVVPAVGLAAPASGTAGLRPVENLSIESTIGVVTLSWTDPHNADGDGFVVCSQRGTTPMAAPSEWCAEDNIERSTSHMAGFPPSWTMTFTVWPRDASGNLGPANSVTTRGSVTTMSTVPSSNSASTGLRLAGRLVDGTSGAPLAQQVLDVIATRPLDDPPEDGPSQLDVFAARLTTNANGEFARTFPLRPGFRYQARFYGGGTRMGNLSKLVPADGSSYIGLDADDPNAARTRSRMVRLVARVASVHRGDRVVFQRMRKGHWRKVAVRSAGSGVAAMRTRVPARKGAAFRALLSSPGRTGQPSVPVKVRRG